MTMHVACAGGIVFDDRGRLLLIQRGRPPAAGTWSVPGGRCEPGETAEQACVREIAEETGLAVVVLRRAGRVAREGPDGVVYDIDDFVCAVRGGTGHTETEPTETGHTETTGDGGLTPGDDAAAARWVNRAEFAGLPLAPLLAQTLASWDCLPRV